MNFCAFFELRVEVPDVDARRHPDFLDLDHMLVLSGFLFLLALFKAELAVIHQLADRRDCLGRDFDQIQALLVSNPQRLRRRHDAQLLASGSNQSDLPVTDLFVQFMH